MMSGYKQILLVAPLWHPGMTGHLILNALTSISLNVETFPYRSIQAAKGTKVMNDLLKARIMSLPRGSLIILIKAESINPKVFLGRFDIRKVLWHFDFNADKPHDWIIRLSKFMNAVFLICEPWVEQLRNLGINAFFLPQATDPRIYHPIETEKKCDISFIGTGANKPGRSEILREIAKEFKLEVWGEQWNEFTPGIPAYLNDFCEVCSHSKIVLNLPPALDLPDYYQTFSQRIYMLASCGTCILTNAVQGLDNFFKTCDTDIEIFTYSSGTILKDIRTLLRDEALLKVVGHAARQRVLKQHTYNHRIKEMFTCLGLLPSALRNTQG